jgi:protein phosphatase
MLLAAHGVSHSGRRTSNEDALLIDLPRRLFVVADGMGGHNAGEVASELAIQTIGEAMASGTEGVDRRLGTAVELANERIFETARRSPECAGMGTTVSAAWILGQRLLFANVGDSRIYRLHASRLTQLTRDDSWISHALATGMPLTRSDIEAHPMRHVLTEVVGVRTDMSVEVHECGLEPGDVLLICSDGLHGAVPDEAIGAALAAERDVETIAKGLVEHAIARGATDNVTAVVVRCN